MSPYIRSAARTSISRLPLVAAALLAIGCADTIGSDERAVAGVGVVPASLTLTAGEERTYEARAFDERGNVVAGRTIAWASSNEAVARVTAAGVVTAVASGTATIRATTDGRTGSAQLVVRPAAVARVEVTPQALAITEGETRTLVAVAHDLAGRVIDGAPVAWESRDPAVAEVDATGRVTARRAGTVVLVATAEGRTAEVSVTVGRVPVATVVVSPAPFTLEVGRTRQLTAVARDAAGNVLAGRTVVWGSDAPHVASVGGATGLVAATGPGYATITATIDGQVGTVSVTVPVGTAEPMSHDLVYHRTYGGVVGEIVIVGAEIGSRPEKVNAGNVSRQPTVSPDGNRIAFFVSQREFDGSQTDDIFAVDRNGMNMRRLTSEPGVDDQPSWSPSGRIAYRRIDAAGRSSLWVMNADGSGKTNLTPELGPTTSVGTPAWSPDGGRLAFSLLQGGVAGATGEIWVMNADGSDKRQLTSSATGYDTDPTWSPDGARIAFSRRYEGEERDVTIVGAAGGATTRLALPGAQWGPAWSPDGRHLAYWQPIGFVGGTAIYTVRVDGTHVRLHTLDPAWGGGYDPAWIRR